MDGEIGRVHLGDFPCCPDENAAPHLLLLLQHLPSNNSNDLRSLKYVKFLGLFFSKVFGAVLIGVGSWIAHDFNAYTALSPSVSYAVASELIIVAGILLFMVSFCCVACDCKETLNENRCTFKLVSIVFVFMATVYPACRCKVS